MSSAGSEAAEHAADAEPLPVADDIDADGMREVGDDAVWSLSTAKPGNGVVQLRDNNVRGADCAVVHAFVCERVTLSH